MKKILILLLCYSGFCWGQNWKIVDIVAQSKKELVYYLDDGEQVEKVKVKNPSIVHLIDTFEQDGYSLEKITHGVELLLDGNLPITRQSQQWGITNLIVDNKHRIMLWFRKKEATSSM